MKNGLLQKMSLCLILIFLLSGFFFQRMYASTETSSKPISLDGDWKKRERSIVLVSFVSASIYGKVLCIQDTASSSDIVVTISHNGLSIYEKTYSESDASHILIDLNGWEEGDYKLELRNEWDGCLFGLFSIN